MINELYCLSDTMSEMRIDADSWHFMYGEAPKSTIRLWVSEDSSIVDFEELDIELISVLRSYGEKRVSTFPVFNIPPMFRITEEQQIKELKNITKKSSELDVEKIKSWCIHDNWNDSRRQTIDKCLHKRSHDLLKVIQKYNLEETRHIVELIRLVDVFPLDNASSFRSSIEACIFNKLQRHENIELSLKLLFQTGEAESNNPIVLDIYDRSKYKYPIASEYTTRWVNNVLQMGETVTDNLVQQDNVIVDAFGVRYNKTGKSEPMPSVTLAGLAGVTLRSMFHEHKCQYRYGMIDDESYPIAKENRARVKQALEWIKDSKRENITWVKADSKELVFAYTSKKPDLLNIVAIFTPPKELESKNATKKFEAVTEDFMTTFKGIPPEKRPDNIIVFSIRKMDKARTKVIYSKNCSPALLIDSANEWRNGCANVPIIANIERFTPYPLRIADIINDVWRQDGTKTKVKSVKYYQGMELLLEHLDKTTLQYYLMLIVTNSFGLISYFGNNDHRYGKCSKDSVGAISSVFSILGLLLYKLDHKKEDYMESVAYLVGQLLKVSDELHVLYSQVVREGSIPPQLAGNSMLIAISEAPSRALALHGQRMLPYIAWAKKYRTIKEKESWKAGWYLSLYERFGTKLNDVLKNDIRFNDCEKAKLFVGYLAAFPVKEKDDVTASADDIENINVKGEEE